MAHQVYCTISKQDLFFVKVPVHFQLGQRHRHILTCAGWSAIYRMGTLDCCIKKCCCKYCCSLINTYFDQLINALLLKNKSTLLYGKLTAKWMVAHEALFLKSRKRSAHMQKQQQAERYLMYLTAWRNQKQQIKAWLRLAEVTDSLQQWFWKLLLLIEEH